MRLSNIDTLSAYFDRLITENIKLYFFKKEKDIQKIHHQEVAIDMIREKISQLLQETFDTGEYQYVGEKRTFDSSSIVEELEDLVTNDIHIGESDRARLRIAQMEEKRLRKANEGRANNKNQIDILFKDMVEVKKMNILITGVAGLLGSRLADWIQKNTKHTVIGIDDMSGGYEENIPKGVKFYEENLSVDNLDSIFEEHKIDIIYHFAAYAAEGLSPFIRKYNYQNNLLASTNLINHAIKHDIQRFVFASSMSVYGNIYNPPFSEDLQPRPIDPYGIAKYSVEQDLRVAYEQHKLPYTIVRPHNFYGRNQNIWDKYRNVLGIWMWQIINGYSPTIFGDGSQVRAFSYVDDSLVPFWNASQKDECVGEIINLGGIHEVSIQKACDTLLKVTGTDLLPEHHEMRHEAHYAYSTWDKSVRMLGFEHKTNLEDGLTKMWEWAQTQPNRNRFVWKNYEIDKGIYSYWKNEEDSNSTSI